MFQLLAGQIEKIIRMIERPKVLESPMLNRKALVTIIMLVLVSILVNADKLVLSEAGPQRTHDGGDFFISSFAANGEFWKAPASALWDSSILRGWPMHLNVPTSPQMLGSMFAAVLPLPQVWPVLQIILLASLVVGSFLFLLLTLRYSLTAALAGSLLNVGLFYWFHEHDGVTSAVLLPALIGFLSIRRGGGPLILCFAGLLAILGISYPAGTLILMPLAHLVLLLFLPIPVSDRRAHLLRWAGFWTIYGVWHGAHLLGAMEHFGVSNRALFKVSNIEISWRSTFATFMALLDNPTVISPGFVLLALVDRRSLRGTFLATMAILLIVAICAFTAAVIRPFAGDQSWLYTVTTSYYRIYYMVPVVVFIWGSWLLAEAETDIRPWTIARRIAMVVMFVVTIRYAPITALSGLFSGLYSYYALWIGLGLLFIIHVTSRNTINAIWTCLIVLTFVLPLRNWFTRIWESPQQGNAFREGRIESVRQVPFRVVTVMRTCESSDIFPAQASIRGRETLDGIANYYDRAFAERWAFYVTQGSSGCTKRFPDWNTRVELILEDFHREPDRIMAWLWVNNVDEVRSSEPLQHDYLRFVEKRDLYDGTPRYLYRLKKSLSRVFLLPKGAGELVGVSDLVGENQWLGTLWAENSAVSINPQEYTGSRIAFSGNFPPEQLIATSVNYHRDWMLYIDGRRSPNHLKNGPFGMPVFAPLDGFHRYALVFEGSGGISTIFSMLAATILLFFLVVNWHPRLNIQKKLPIG